MNKTIQLLKENDNFLIITHKKPDGDTTGSAGALCEILRRINKTAFILENEDITPRYEPLIAEFYPTKDFKPEFIISTDIASTSLFTQSALEYEDKIDLCIDHHVLSNNGFAKHNLLVDYAACGEIIYEIMNELCVEMNEKIATAIYTSISTDTGCFKYQNTTCQTHEIAAKCVPLIQNIGVLNRNLFDLKTRGRLEIEARVLQNLKFYFDGKLAMITISNQDKKETNATADDLDSIASLPRTIEGVEIAYTLTELANGDIKVSARSSGDVSVSEVCETYGGGGHLRAAGCTFKNQTFKQVSEKMIEATKTVAKYV